jgi:hypothetical protein
MGDRFGGEVLRELRAGERQRERGIPLPLFLSKDAPRKWRGTFAKFGCPSYARKADWPPALMRRPVGAPLARETSKLVP